MTVSDNYTRIHDKEEARRLDSQLHNSWQDPSIPQQQWSVAGHEVHELKMGKRVPPLSNFLDLVGMIPEHERGTLVEIGCGVGHYEDVLRIGNIPCQYTGVDYSPAMGKWFFQWRRDTPFFQADATNLPFLDRSFDVSVEGASMLHIFDYPKVVKEALRISKKWSIFHRVPLSNSGEVVYWKKTAYGVPCLEIHFGLRELVSLWTDNGFSVKGESRISQNPEMSMVSFLLRREETP